MGALWILLAACRDPARPADKLTPDRETGTPDTTDTSDVLLPPAGPDVDGDGIVDVVIGAPGALAATGRVYVYSAGALADGPSLVLTGDPGDRLGGWIEAAPDGDGDGADDLLIGQGDAVGFFAAAGRRAYVSSAIHAVAGNGDDGPVVVMANDTALTIAALSAPTTPIYTIDRSDVCWNPVSMRILDLDQDGFDDLLYTECTSAWFLGGPLDDPPGAPEMLDADWTDAVAVDLGGALGLVDPVQDGWEVVRDPLGDAETHDVAIDGRLHGGLAVADFDGDGRMEVAAAHVTEHAIEVYGLLTGEPVATLPDPDAATDPDDDGDTLTTADVDGDGLLDLVAARPWSFAGGSVDVWRSVDFLAGAPYLTVEAPDAAGAFHIPSVAGPGDADGDGRGEIVVATRGRGLTWLDRDEGEPDGLLDGEIPDRVAEFVAPAGDVDGDGTPDLLVTLPENQKLEVFRGDAAGFSPWSSDSTAGGHEMAALGDVDGDGFGDLGTWQECACSYPDFDLYFGGEDGPVKQSVAQVNANAGSGVAGRDLDGDGYADLVVAGSGTVWVWPGGPDGIPTTTNLVWDNVGYAVALPGDFDGDGGEDILVGAMADGGFPVSVIHPPEDGVAARFEVDAIDGEVPVIASVGDLDGDGRPDVVVGSGSCDVGASVHVVLGGEPPEWLPDPGGVATCGPTALGDVDGDGFPDFAVRVLPAAGADLEEVYVVHGGPDVGALRTTLLEPPGAFGARFGAGLR